MFKFSELTHLQDILDSLLTSNNITLGEYEKEWRDIIELSGWCETSYFLMIDDSW